MAGCGRPWQVLVALDGFAQLVRRQLLDIRLLLLAHPVVLVFRLERVLLPEVPGLI